MTIHPLMTLIQGMLLTGPPGSGKSFLVDMWSASLPTPYKVRLHYNEFVLQLYRGIWEETQRRMAQAASAPRPTHSISWTHTVRRRWHALTASGGMPYTSTTSDPSISFELARRLVLRHWLLVFDEVQLLDVSSAGVLADVLSWFWRLGGVVIGTSNAVPNDLYRQGVARERLAPFLEALEARCPVMEMQGAQDWRVARAELDMDNATWFTFKQAGDFEDAIKAVIREEPTTIDLNIFGRCLRVPWAADGVAKFRFADLCNQVGALVDHPCTKLMTGSVSWSCRLPHPCLVIPHNCIDRHSGLDLGDEEPSEAFHLAR
jgi:protein AFG1